MSSKYALKIENVSIGYGKHSIIMSGVNVLVPSGVRCAIIGLNGSGKTTLLNSILGLIPSYGGSIYFFDKNFSDLRDLVAYVPQIKTIDWSFPITVKDVVGMGCYVMNGLFSCDLVARAKERIWEAMAQMNLVEQADRQINNLSGGQKQRVFMARAIAQQPDMYILDEPLTGLDMISEKIIIDLFYALTEKGKTIIAVHHDLYTLYEYFNWVVIMYNGILYCGPLERNKVDPLIKEAFFRSV